MPSSSNGTSDATTRLTIPALLRDAARESGERPYVISPEGRLTYAEAEDRSARIARWLLHEGAGKGTRVGLFFPNGVEWATWWLAISRIGAVAVPLSTLYAPAEIAKVLRLADVGILVAPSRVLKIDVPARFEEALPGLRGQETGRIALQAAPYLRRIVLTDDATPEPVWATTWDPDGHPMVPAEVLAAVEAEVSPADLAIMIHTSGSTADPKGVLHTHGTIVRQTSTWPAAVRAISGTDGHPVIVCAMPFFWIGGVLAAMGALHSAAPDSAAPDSATLDSPAAKAATLLVLPRLEAGAALDLAERERATGIVGWPAFTQQLREHPTFPDRDLSSAPSLRDGPLDLAMAGVPDRYPIHRSLTESGGGFAFTEIAIVDEHGAPVPAGTTGELLIRGTGVMAGYNKRERADVFDADGWYHTADRVFRADGDPRLFYVGRTSDLIKSAGANVAPLEVEAAIGESGDVAQCVVIGVDNPSRGEEVCALVVPAADLEPADLDLDKLAAWTRERLSAYKVPTRWIITSGDQLPTLPSGKLDRKTLRTRVADETLS